MIAKYMNHFSILPMFTPTWLQYSIGNINGLLLNYYWIIVQIFVLFFLGFLNDSVFLISIWI